MYQGYDIKACIFKAHFLQTSLERCAMTQRRYPNCNLNLMLLFSRQRGVDHPVGSVWVM